MKRQARIVLEVSLSHADLTQEKAERAVEEVRQRVHHLALPYRIGDPLVTAIKCVATLLPEKKGTSRGKKLKTIEERSKAGKDSGRSVKLYARHITARKKEIIVLERERSLKEGWMAHQFPFSKRGLARANKLFDSLRV